MSRLSTRSPQPAAWPVLAFFLIGAAGAILWDLHGRTRPSPEVSGFHPGHVATGPAPRLSQRAARPAVRQLVPAPAAVSRPARSRKADPKFARVGIPIARRNETPAAPSSLLHQEQAGRILRNLIESRGYYGISPECLRAHPLGYREGSYAFEVVAAGCASIAAGSVVGRWRVDAITGEAAYRTSEGTYTSAP